PTSSTAPPVAPRHRPSFPTRRSSDLGVIIAQRRKRGTSAAMRPELTPSRSRSPQLRPIQRRRGFCGPRLARYALDRHSPPAHVRSEEHTSELQSRENLVCRLLLEKKN